MSKIKTPQPNGIHKTKRTAVAGMPLRESAGVELHQLATGGHATLTTNQGVGLSDNQNSLKANPHGPLLLEDFIL